MLAADPAMDQSGHIDTDGFMDALDQVLPDGFRLAYAMIRNVDDAGDIVQEATLRAWRHRRSLRPGASIRPWFLAIVANQCRRTVKDRWWSVLKRSDLTAMAQQVDLARLDDTDSLRQGLLQLTERDRLILILRYYLDLSFEDVAATLKVSPGAARVRAHRALARLRPIIDIPEEGW
jgi:RNA polymerase sigma factor (sigma-70 family)